MADKINIAYAPDDNYVNQTIVSMTSAILNNKNKEIEFIILYDNLKDENIKKLNWFQTKDNVKLRLLKVDASCFKPFVEHTWFPVSAWLRTLLPRFCSDLDKILYLDGDTMIYNNLDELFDIDLSNYIVAVVKDVWDIEKNSKLLNLKSNTYFNSGVMLINTKKWNEEDIESKIIDFAKNNPNKLNLADQSALNVVLDENKLLIHQKFNYMETWWRNYYFEYENEDEKNYEEAKKNPVIVHFTGLKPNYKGCKNSFCNSWFEYAKQTPFFDEIKEIFDKSEEKKEKEKFISKIFSIKNEYGYKAKTKVITILGFKIRHKIK